MQRRYIVAGKQPLAIVAAMFPLMIIFLVVLLEVLCIGAVYPAISYYCTELGGGPVVVGFIFALMSGPKVIMTPIWGRLSDRWGRKPLLAMATVGTFSGSLFWGLAPHLGGLTALTWLMVSRTLTGVFGAHAGLAQAVAADTSRPEKRAAAMGVMGAAFGLGFTFGPLLGGMVATRYSYAHVGFVCAGLECVSLLIILLALPETRPAAERESASVAGGALDQKMLLAQPGVGWLLLVTLLMTLGFAHVFATFPLLAESWYAFDARRTGLAFMVLGLIGVVIQAGGIRVLVARYGERATIVVGLLALAGGFAVLATHPGRFWLWAALSLIAVGSALAMPPLIALLSRCVGEADQGGVLGLNQSVTGLGRAASFVLGGYLYNVMGAPTLYVAGAVVLLGALILFAIKCDHPSPPSSSLTGA